MHFYLIKIVFSLTICDFLLYNYTTYLWQFPTLSDCEIFRDKCKCLWMNSWNGDKPMLADVSDVSICDKKSMSWPALRY